MQKKNVKNEVELSRRGFFSRFAVGALLTIGIPVVVQAVEKADKSHKMAKASRTAVRLPKQVSSQSSKVGHPANKLMTHNSTGKLQKISAGHSHKSPEIAHSAHGNHDVHPNNRVRDKYNGKNPTILSASNHHGNRHHHGGKSQSLIQPVQDEYYQDQMLVASRGRYATHRSLAIQNPHTGDKLSLTYFEKGRYLNDALEEISFLLRDYRTGDVYPIDPELLDQLHDLKEMLGLNQAFDVICGYRSPLTNAQLHAEHSGVASNSFHMHGRAVDVRIERFDLRRIHNAAIAMHRGGIGYYPGSNFIHLDTGTFRTWSL